jgi:hypothetical protein
MTGEGSARRDDLLRSGKREVVGEVIGEVVEER